MQPDKLVKTVHAQRCTLLGVLALALASGVPVVRAAPPELASAQGEWRSLLEKLSGRVRGELVKEIKLVRREGVKVGLVNTDELADLGMFAGPAGLRTRAQVDSLLAAGAFRPATEEEIAQGKVDLVAYATRYADDFGGKRRWVQGDGRAVTTGEILLRDPLTGRFVGSYQVQLKGVPTGLAPLGEGPTDHHGYGRLELWKAVLEVLKTDYFRLNDVPTERWLALLLTGERFDYTIYNPRTKKKDWQTDRKGALLVRGGEFIRLAHLWHFRDDPGALRQLLDYVEEQVRARIGRSERLKPVQLHRAILAQKAAELAAGYWARVGQGLLSFDNNAFLQKVDSYDWIGLDRWHPEASARKDSPGFAHEARVVLGWYGRHLGALMAKTIPWLKRPAFYLHLQGAGAFARREFERQMTHHALLHLGLDADETELILREHPEQARALMRAVREVGETQAKGADYKQANGGKIADPAAYDIFGALGALAHSVEHADLDGLVEAMRSLKKEPEVVREAAEKLQRAARPVLEILLRGLRSEVRREKVAMVAEQARSINKPVINQHGFLMPMARRLADELEKKNDRSVESEINAFARANIRKGRRSPAGRALLLRRGQLPAKADGRIVLSALTESGVTIEELSDGVQDCIGVRLAEDPLWAVKSGGTISQYEMSYTLDGKRWQTCTAGAVEGKDALFEVKLDPACRPERFEAKFSHPKVPKTRTWSNYQRGFGKGMPLALSSLLTDAELAIVAHHRGKTRAQTPRARLEAALRSVVGRRGCVPRR